MDKSGDFMDYAIAAFRSGRSGEAADAFRRIVELTPESVDAHLYLALALGPERSPDPELEENRALEAEMERALRRATELDPRNWIGWVFLGQHMVSDNRFGGARAIFRRALDLEPERADIRFAYARTGFEQWISDGKPEGATAELVQEFERALSRDRLNDAAMEYIALILEHGSGEGTESARWREAGADARSERTQLAIAEGKSYSRGGKGSLLQQWAEAVLTPLPPLVPPPPPDPRLAISSEAMAGVSFYPIPETSEAEARPIRADPEVQAGRLIRRVEPVIPGDPIPGNELRFVVVIGADGRIRHDVPISGNCWLYGFGRDALRQWEYEPTYVDGTPVEVVTDVRLTVRN